MGGDRLAGPVVEGAWRQDEIEGAAAGGAGGDGKLA
jgi:hypothetical protein